MADQSNPHFNQIFWFIVYSFTVIIGFAAAVIFIPIPKENFNLANTIIIFLLGTGIGGGIGYLLGGNPTIPQGKKQPDNVQQMDVKADEVNVNDK